MQLGRVDGSREWMSHRMRAFWGASISAEPYRHWVARRKMYKERIRQ